MDIETSDPAISGGGNGWNSVVTNCSSTSATISPALDRAAIDGFASIISNAAANGYWQNFNLDIGIYSSLNMWNTTFGGSSSGNITYVPEWSSETDQNSLNPVPTSIVIQSRAYQLTDGYLIQLSEGDASPNGLLTASLGGRSSYEDVSLHVARVAVDVSVRILLASDGLFGHVPIEELERQIDPDLLTSVARLTSLALDAGGPDNVTVAMVDAAVVANGEKGGT
jgi:hypothetical protein